MKAIIQVMNSSNLKERSIKEVLLTDLAILVGAKLTILAKHWNFCSGAEPRMYD